MKNIVKVTLLLFGSILTKEVTAQEIMPNVAVSSIPVVSISEISSENSSVYTIMNTVTATANVFSDNNKKSRIIKEKDNEFRVAYKRKIIDNKGWLIYDDCEGVIRLGYLDDMATTSSGDYFYAEEIVRRLAIYRLINIAKEYGADAILTPTIITTAKPVRKDIEYQTEISAKLIKVKSN